VIGLVDDSLDPQSALDRPRFCIQDGTAGGQVALEEGIAVHTMAALAEMGHAISPVSGFGRSVFGRGQIILREAQSGVLCAGSDPRADGCAMTF
jgi:gamma-glutamyltranspeptidase/glutathione hydrolase